MREPIPESRGFERRPAILDYIGAGGLDEDDAREVAESIVRHAREAPARESEVDIPRAFEAPAPDPAEVRERRQRHREARTRTSE